ncbi:glutamate-cysteine ligase family protein [Glycomyces algeriensis]|uniref:Glutamate--cysteine ligase EgtA n=1 Tax=Glycomyces algeriensis TaxID=256037 RepID=A0A9W6G394_9ACTN|nr:glutamate-cysteine ligase family protein [Glycomyces algeriensis]MDA1368721.1 glutamate-cysteine ligase family protein [Glycomyces algeriensis]MDR7352506.1 glutamate--cysteine ligase [Glycomyces algeriensis]GLI40189.1 glutamate--cysteine ligase EgtA [Glycomyces algeriensis]
MDTFLSADDAAAFIGRWGFTTGPSRRVGVELEWLVDPRGDLETGWDLPNGGTVSREAGGQAEMSSAPADDLAACIASAETDQAALEAALATRGQTVRGGGFDGVRNPVRHLDEPRYRAMEAYYDRKGPWGRMVMCGTASVQINLDAGDDDAELRRRWDLAHRLGPVLIAAFANSPELDGRPSGWKSTRQALWHQLPGWGDPVSEEGDLRRDFAKWVLDAEMVCAQCEPPREWDVPPGMTLRDWISSGHDGRRPTRDDVEYHMSTLFPPVRPRGWLELRMIDQQDGDGWIVPAIVATTLIDDPRAATAAYEATAALCDGRPQPPTSVWEQAARSGLADRGLHDAALACFAASAEALERMAAPQRLRSRLAEFRSRFTDPGRCPADDRLEALRGTTPQPQEATL